MQRITSALLALPIALSVGSLMPGTSRSALAQRVAPDIWELHEQLQAAVCQNDWSEALSVINPMLGMSNLSAQYRQDLIQFRQQMLGWRRQGRVFNNQPNCDRPSNSTSSRPPETPPSEPQASGPQPDEAIATRPNRSLASECEELTTIVDRADAEARSLFQLEGFADLNALLQTLQRLATLSDQIRLSLEAVRFSDFQLRRYQQNFVSVYTQFGQATRGFVEAADANNASDMEAKHSQIQTVTEQETSLINQVNRYCSSANPS